LVFIDRRISPIPSSPLSTNAKEDARRIGRFGVFKDSSFLAPISLERSSDPCDSFLLDTTVGTRTMTAKQFRVARIKLGLSTEQMAQALGLTARAVRYYEAGERPISGPVQIAVKCLLEHRR
jgi:DNA-binding XRE family transcriptional regulator